jgi:hypothetical protein
LFSSSKRILLCSATFLLATSPVNLLLFGVSTGEGIYMHVPVAFSLGAYDTNALSPKFSTMPEGRNK